MYRLVHVMLGFSVGLLIGGGDYTALYYGLMGGFGGYIPDLDLRRGHRKYLHNVVVPFLLFLTVFSLTMFYTSSFSIRLFIGKTLLAVLAGWVLHVLSDSITPRGVYILWPLSNRRIALTRRLKSSGLLSNGLVVGLSVLIMLVWFNKYVYTRIEDVLESFIDELLSLLS